MQALSEDGSSDGSGQSVSCRDDSASSPDEGSNSGADAGAGGRMEDAQQGSPGEVVPVMLDSSPV